MDKKSTEIHNEPLYVTDIGIAIAGSVDSGKSTFAGVLTSGKLDNGDGSARQSIARYRHEIQSGKTSAISSKYIPVENNRAITLIDLCGHEKYFKTTAYGIAGYYPDYAFLIVSANRGILPMTKQHITLLVSMNIPIVIIVSRYDITPEATYQTTLKMIDKYCRDIIKTQIEIINNPYVPLDDKDVKLDKIKSALNITHSQRQLFIPVITISNKTGYYIDFVKNILNILEPRDLWINFDKDTTKTIVERCTNRVIKSFLSKFDLKLFPEPSINNFHVFFIDSIYNPPGIGNVIAGINRHGTINVGDIMYLGPFGKEFKEVRIKSMRNYAKQKILTAKNHERITIAIASNDKDINRSAIRIRKGMILIKSKDLIKTHMCYRFNAIVTIFNHSATLKTNYSPITQIGNIRQTTRMYLDPALNNSKDCIKSKDYAYVTFKFKQRPEFVEPYQIFFFMSGNVHGLGIVLDIIPLHADTDAKPDPTRTRYFINVKTTNTNVIPSLQQVNIASI